MGKTAPQVTCARAFIHVHVCCVRGSTVRGSAFLTSFAGHIFAPFSSSSITRADSPSLHKAMEVWICLFCQAFSIILHSCLFLAAQRLPGGCKEAEEEATISRQHPCARLQVAQLEGVTHIKQVSMLWNLLHCWEKLAQAMLSILKKKIKIAGGDIGLVCCSCLQ